MKISFANRLIIMVMFAVSLSIAGYYSVYDRLPFGGLDSICVPLVSVSSKIMVVDVLSKVTPTLSPKEYVMIGDQRYEVVEPWLGHRIADEVEPGKLDFAMLPVHLVMEQRRIYVTSSTRDAYVKMAAAAALDGIELLVDSGYRSVAYQQRIFQKKMAAGEDFYEIARGVAPPGYSEHMLGTTLDLVPSKWTFSGTPADEWLRENGADFAFVLSYPQKSDLGFTWEPWHWKYVGDS
jgi:D-alanyl-D-alanine carboxypeptidase